MAMARTVLIVPPLIKYSSGPLLGPSLLQSAARRGGHECSILDLNAHFLQPRTPKRTKHGVFIGDHDKPVGENSLNEIEKEFMSKYILPGICREIGDDDDDGLQRRVQFGFLTHEEIQTAATTMVSSSFGTWVQRVISQQQQVIPDVVGLSLLHAGQVIPATALSMMARMLWPDSLVVWGGPHISGLGEKTLREDLRERSFAADVFVTGHAEKTFVDILDDVARGAYKSRGVPVVVRGTRGVTILSPTFDDANLDLYDSPLTLPAQSSLGCSYGKCAFCTYPAIEPTPTRLGLESSVGVVADMAKTLGASVSIKDSLVTSRRLCEIGDCIANRAQWSACTKLSSRLDLDTLSGLRLSGLATLEVGLESLLPETQKRIGKVQPQSLYEEFVSNVAKVPDLTLVVNYMTGFPWEQSQAALAKREEARAILTRHLGAERARIESNEFELERLAPMARYPELYGIDMRNIASWPWASVLEWQEQAAKGRNDP
jgi:hypothetical protein